jgi:type IV secretion system protein VirB5
MRTTLLNNVHIKTPGEDAASDSEPRTSQTNPEGYNPYLEARRKSDDRYGDLASRIKKADRIALICGVVALISIIGFVVIALRPAQIRIVVVDRDGQYLGSSVSGQYAAVTKDMKRSVVADWLSNWRLVTTDSISQRSAIDRVYSMISSGSAAQTSVTDFYRRNPPQDRGRTETVHVQVNSVVSTSDTTCQVEWLETERDLQGKVLTEKRLKGIFTFVVSAKPSGDERLLRFNPIGLYITDANWSEVL